MCCEQLLCAACGGRVSEARCTTCVASRAHVHHSRGTSLTPELVAVLVALAVLVSLALRAA